MNVDIIFFNSDFANKEEFISDEEKFQEYISTHSFEANFKELVLIEIFIMDDCLPLLSNETGSG